MKLPKPLKIIIGVIIFFTLPSALFIGFIYFKYNEDLPKYEVSKEADELAQKMLDALDYKALENTNYLEWTFRNSHHFEWERDKQLCHVFWKQYKVSLDLNDSANTKAYVHSFTVTGQQRQELIDLATSYFHNDSFWLLAPYKVFDEGTERGIVKLDDGSNGLMVRYKSGGTTPGDSYLWKLDKDGKPLSFKMWTSIVPIQGLEASWEHWTTTKSGAQLPTLHKILFLGIELRDIKGTNE
jgi:hypothetical protein